MTNRIRSTSASICTDHITKGQSAVTISLATTTPERKAPKRVAALVVAGMAALAGIGLTASTAGASTLGGTATIASPGTATALASGGSTTQFTVSLPSAAACTGDTATGGYHIYSYLIHQSASVSAVTFQNSPSSGFGFVDIQGTYYGPINAQVGTGQITGIPNDFEWGTLVSIDSVPLSTLLYTGTGASASGIWEAGIACANTTGALSDNWNTELTFTASASDPNGFVWSAVPGVTTTTTTTTTTSTSTTTTDPNSATTTPTTSDPSATTTPTTTPTDTTPTTGVSSTPGTVSDSSTTPTGSGGTLAFTGLHTATGLGVGLLAVGLGLMLLGWGYRRKLRPARQAGKDA
jgi:hypothetical protein